MLAAKLASQEERLKQEKNKVKEVIQAQRDVRKSINASSSKREPDLSSPGKPDARDYMPSSAQKSRKVPTTGSAPTEVSLMGENMTGNYAKLLNENERLRLEKMELENSNHILRKFKRIYNQTA